ncbi:MAG TPA: Clp protease N-terminal domain-containing protein [Longimicrobium sp.]|nr:Clp protease N-terminal domain-containing protein [Longimicrobium sp.]
MNYNFTDRVRKVLAMAREEAVRLRHDYVGTEHILLGVAHESEGVAAAVLARLGVGAEDVRKAVDRSLPAGRAGTGVRELLPCTVRAQKVLEFAIEEAHALDHDYVGTEHLLLGLLRDEEGMAARVLAEFGVTLEAARREVRGLLAGHVPVVLRSASSAAARAGAGATERAVRGTAVLEREEGQGALHPDARAGAPSRTSERRRWGMTGRDDCRPRLREASAGAAANADAPLADARARPEPAGEAPPLPVLLRFLYVVSRDGQYAASIIREAARGISIAVSAGLAVWQAFNWLLP